MTPQGNIFPPADGDAGPQLLGGHTMMGTATDQNSCVICKHGYIVCVNAH